MGKSKIDRWNTPAGITKIEELAAGSTDSELALALGIAASTLYKWMAECSEIADAIIRGRTGAQAVADVKAVEGSLLERCLGGPKTIMKAVKLREVTYDPEGKFEREIERVEMVAETVYVPADTNAIKFYLTNRAPERWKNKTEISADLEALGGVEEFLHSLTSAGGGGRKF